MNLTILIKCLAAIVPFTGNVGGSSLGGDAFYLQQRLEMIARDPQLSQQINQALAQAVCGDWGTFENMAGFVLACLSQGKQANLQGAYNTLNQIAGKFVQG